MTNQNSGDDQQNTKPALTSETGTSVADADRSSQDRAAAVVQRVLSRAGTALDEFDNLTQHHDGDQLEREERAARGRVAGLGTELEDVSEVEYRELRLENVVLAGVWSKGSEQDAQISLRELAALAQTAGSQVLDSLLQHRDLPDAATYLGSGKAKELATLVAQHRADTVIIDGELSPSQRRALEDVVKVKVIDRTTLILDIFAQHAKSREGKAQVELAQLEYLLPRLRGWGESMSRQAGGRVAGGAGIGSRGPGETKIELDRRRIRTRMAKLRREITAMQPAREAKRAERQRNKIPSVAIVGYTNAGKSSLLNALTHAGVLVQNVLFATLDPTVRRAQTPDGREFTLVDTVGFVRSLPHELVEAFRSTLEEVALADVILHVVDASHPAPQSQIEAVREVLRDIEAVEQIPEFVAFNKCDAVADDEVAALLRTEPKSLAVSALTLAGIPELLDELAQLLPRPDIEVMVTIPYNRGDLVSKFHDHGEVLELKHQDAGTYIRGRVKPMLASELERSGLWTAGKNPA